MNLSPQPEAWAARLKEADAPEKLPWLHGQSLPPQARISLFAFSPLNHKLKNSAHLRVLRTDSPRLEVWYAILPSLWFSEKPRLSLTWGE
jgi:hypothetical protein